VSCNIFKDKILCILYELSSETYLIILMAICWLVLWSNARMTWPKLPLPITSRISYRYDMWSCRTLKVNSKYQSSDHYCLNYQLCTHITWRQFISFRNINYCFPQPNITLIPIVFLKFTVKPITKE
jgi:hypothetical protein